MAYVGPRDGWRPQDTEVHKVLAFLEKKGVDMAAARKKADNRESAGSLTSSSRDSPALRIPGVPLIIREGGAQRISHTWGTQVPQQLPTECPVPTRSVACFHLEGLAADAVCDHFRLGDEAPEVLRGLERGEFLLFCQGRDWDRTIDGAGLAARRVPRGRGRPRARPLLGWQP